MYSIDLRLSNIRTSGGSCEPGCQSVIRSQIKQMFLCLVVGFGLFFVFLFLFLLGGKFGKSGANKDVVP